VLVTLGPPGQEDRFPCVIIALNDTEVVCRTAAGEGQLLVFRVQVRHR